MLTQPVTLPPRRLYRRHRHTKTDAERRQAYTPSPTLFQPPADLPLGETEWRYFQLFQSRTASEMSGYFDHLFWTRIVLQECHSDVVVRHAGVALGALYKTLEESSHQHDIKGTPGSPPVCYPHLVASHWQVAVKQYSDACNAMVLLAAENQRSHRTQLIACILLASFDSFIGDHKQAIVQIQTGLGYLKQLQVKQAGKTAHKTGETIEDDLLNLFKRFTIQAKSYDMAFHFPLPYVIRLASSQSDGPTMAAFTKPDWASPEISSQLHHFTTLYEARVASDRIYERMLIFMEKLNTLEESLGSTNFIPQLDTWARAFEPMFQSRSAKTDPLERAGIASLKMFQLNAKILFSMLLCDTEGKFDAFFPMFKQIVDLGYELVQEDESRAAAQSCPIPELCTHRQEGNLAPHTRPTFAAYYGIVPPLFVVATKCRDPLLRRQAIQLLRSCARREGMWDSELAARIGEWVMHLEESESAFCPLSAPSIPVSVAQKSACASGSLPSSLSDKYLTKEDLMFLRIPPEARRVTVKSVEFDLRAHYADVKVGMRGIPLSLPDDRYRETRLTW